MSAATRAPVRAAEDAPDEVSSDSGSAAKVGPMQPVRIGTAASFDGGGAGATVRAVFRNLLVLPDGEINDPAVFMTPVPNYYVGEVFMLGDGGQLRIVHLDLKLDEAAVEHLYQQGINGIWIVEPVE